MRVIQVLSFLILLAFARGDEVEIDANGESLTVPADAAPAKINESKEACECSDLTRSIEEKLNAVNTMHESAKAKVEESTATIQRLESALVHAEQHAKEMQLLKAQLSEKEELLRAKDAEIAALLGKIQVGEEKIQNASEAASKDVAQCQQSKAQIERELNEAVQSKRDIEGASERYKVARTMEIDELKKDLKDAKQSSARYLEMYNGIKGKHESTHEELQAARSELTRIVSDNQMSYCNTTAIRHDATEWALSTQKSVARTLKPYMQKGTVESEAILGKVLQHAHMGATQAKSHFDKIYDKHLKVHVDAHVKPTYTKHVEPQMKVVKKKMLEAVKSTRLFCASGLREGCKNWMWWIQLREGTLPPQERASSNSSNKHRQSGMDRFKEGLKRRQDDEEKNRNHAVKRPTYPDWLKNGLTHCIENADTVVVTGAKVLLALYVLCHLRWTIGTIFTILFLPVLIPLWIIFGLARKTKKPNKQAGKKGGGNGGKPKGKPNGKPKK